MAKKVILFDLDGTLTDSGEGIMNCAELALRHFGLEVPSHEEMRVFVGPPLYETFQKFGVPADKTDEAVQVFRSRYLPIGKFENYPYPGIRELLEALRNDDCTLYVATSKPEVTAVEVLEHFDLAHYFTRICGAAMDKSRSTKSDVIAYLLSANPLDSKAIMIGDTGFDVVGAAEHGIPTIGVSWGYGNKEDIAKAGALAIADTPAQLLDLLRSL